MPAKDFSILFEKVSTSSGSKDIAIVKNYNAYAQYIENVFKTQKGESISDKGFGSGYYSYIFTGLNNIGQLENELAASVQNSVKNIFSVNVKTQYYSQDMFQFLVTYKISDSINSAAISSAFIEVPIQ